ncbi:MAG TPA: hypothetical protein VFN15_03360 [Solirubrobacterales bacterium]|nr:hypothetical protein [Solirubrobacterales bacterium]
MQGALTRRRSALAAAAIALALAGILALQQLGDASRAGAAPSAEAAKKGKSRYFIVGRKFRVSRANDGQRLTVLCPGRSEPLGGGMVTDPPAADGEGVYPHSFERLGLQSGYHISVVLYDPSPGSTQARTVRLQVLCGPKYGKVTPPHTTLNMGANEKNVAVARCPGRRFLIGGGYQRTNFTNTGGILATESRAISPKAWRVTGLGLGKWGGQMTSIGYCVRAKKPLLRTVSASVIVPPRGFAEAVTGKCPKGRRVVFGGFETPDTGALLPSGGYFKTPRSWSVSAYNASKAPATVTAFGHCAKL